ncbi:glycoside hydrolase family 3 protein [Candidatus Pelagibacter sp.]|nr:glycoside hydrolase family 3 protein [Candidatus Pelagibacter sp.]
MNNRRAFIVGLKSTEISSQEQLFLKKYKPWGVILFTRNIKNLNQTKKLTSKIRNIFNDKKYPIMIDQEGGRVSRLENIISFKNLTSDFFGKKYVKNKKDFDIYFKIFIDKTSYLLKELGININSVPVLDLRISGSSKIIGDRSFSRDPNIASKIGDICIKAYKENSIGTIIKHIPGHGLAKVDSHFSTPYINKSLQYLLKNDFKAFKNKDSFFAMTGHLIFNQIDKDNTVTHSRKMIDIIRKKVGFRNLLISDDLSMKSLKKGLKINTIDTFKAGCNLALHCNGKLKEMEIVGKNSPLISKFIIKKTSQFYNILR